MRYLMISLLFALGALGCDEDGESADSDDTDTYEDTDSIDMDTDVADPDLIKECDGPLTRLDLTTGICWRLSVDGCVSGHTKDQYQTIVDQIAVFPEWRLPEIHEVLTLVRNCDFSNCPLFASGCTTESCVDYASCDPCFGPNPFIDEDLDQDDRCLSIYSNTTVGDMDDRVWVLHVTDNKVAITHVSKDIAQFENGDTTFHVRKIVEPKK